MLVLLSASCSSPPVPATRPNPTLAESPEAQAEFRRLAASWHAGPPRQRNLLEADLQAFLAHHGDDDGARLARVYLAWILIHKGKLIEAQRHLEKTRRGPAGSAQDFATVADSALLIQYGRPTEAIKQLRPLQGKIIDPTERFLATEQLVVASLAAQLYAEALLYMVDWAEQADAHQRQGVRASIRSRVRLIPTRYLEEAFATVRQTQAGSGGGRQTAERRWLGELITQRLREVALERRDVKLARRLLKQGDGQGKDPNDPLRSLATEGESKAIINGRTVGLLLSTRAAQFHQRSADAASGLTEALDLMRPGSVSVDLVTAIADGQVGAVAAGLNELAEHGASVLVAGVDERDARAAAYFAENAQIPVLLLHPVALGQRRYTFSLGISDETQEQALTSALQKQGYRHPVVLDPSSLHCDATEHSLARPTFPLAQWRREEVDAFILIRPSPCSTALLTERLKGRFHSGLAFGLEVARTVRGDHLGSALSLRAGSFPLSPTPQTQDGEGLASSNEGRPSAASAARSEPDAPKLATWGKRLGRQPRWYEALGRDAGLLAKTALLALPSQELETQSKVRTFHRQLRQALSASTPPLVTAAEGRFDEQLNLRRTLTSDIHPKPAKRGSGRQRSR